MVRRHLIKVLVAAGMALSIPAAALAETAEEAVAYALMGLADGAHLERGKTTMDWKEVSASPAVFSGNATIGGKPVHITFTVSATDPCRYEVAVEGPMVPGGKALYARVDLASVSTLGISADALQVEVSGEGFCETGQTNPNCMPVNRSDLFGFVDAERHAKLLAFIRADVCPVGGGAP